MLQEARRDYPGYKVTIGKSKTKEQKNAFAGLDYTYMEKYIAAHDDDKKTIMAEYAQRVFGMYGGTKQLVTIRFINPLLDTAVERFGTKDAIYAKVDDRHFSVTAQVEVSDLFYGWLLGFGKRVKLTYSDEAVEEFKAYLEKVYSMYKSNS